MREKSEIDLWVRVVLWAAMLLIAAALFLLPTEERLIGYAIGIPMLIVILWICFGTYFEFKEDYLYCRCGPFYEKIRYEKIKSVKLSENMLSSMALSRRRIEILQHGKGYIAGTTYISPRNRERFMEELIARCKYLE